MQVLAGAAAAALVTLAASVAANTISGQVRDSSTNSPIQNATLVLTNVANPSPQLRFTGADGLYSFDFTAFGIYDLRVFAAGYYGDQRTVIPIPGLNPNPVVNFALDPRPTGTGSITGTITNAANGSRISGAVIEVYDATRPDAIYTISTSLPLPAPSPNYSVTGLATNTYRLRVSANGFIPAERTGVAVTDGVPTPGIDIALSAGQASIQGTVLIGNTSRPVEAAFVALLDSSLRPVGSATTAANGTFTLSGLGPGSYTATAAHNGFDAGGTLILNLGATETRTGVVIRLTNSAAPRPPVTLAAEWVGASEASATFPASIDENPVLGHGDVLEYRVYATPAGGAESRVATVTATDALSYQSTFALNEALAPWTLTVRAWDGFLESEDSTAAELGLRASEAWILR